MLSSDGEQEQEQEQPDQAQVTRALVCKYRESDPHLNSLVDCLGGLSDECHAHLLRVRRDKRRALREFSRKYRASKRLDSACTARLRRRMYRAARVVGEYMLRREYLHSQSEWCEFARCIFARAGSVRVDASV